MVGFENLGKFDLRHRLLVHCITNEDFFLQSTYFSMLLVTYFSSLRISCVIWLRINIVLPFR